MITSPLGAYRPGTTLLHKIPAGPKIGLLALYGVVTVVAKGPWTALGFVAFSLLLVAWARLPLRSILRAMRPLLLVITFVTVFQVWQRGWPTAIHVIGDLLALVIAALVFTGTTPIDAMLDAITRGLGPFRRFGVNPEKVALAFSLMIRAIPRNPRDRPGDPRRRQGPRPRTQSPSAARADGDPHRRPGLRDRRRPARARHRRRLTVSGPAPPGRCLSNLIPPGRCLSNLIPPGRCLSNLIPLNAVDKPPRQGQDDRHRLINHRARAKTTATGCRSTAPARATFAGTVHAWTTC
ncbi:energy-coupling factor transporter transmembrane component T family protein [Aeromicrobium sp. UC242_57]|uniref:energy-coupling factor transporter transmembrane component T family protein n=1 Tax=Aeromicrobium sp. UC242_57 TaxID=3374624 RepID=UPI0037897313